MAEIFSAAGDTVLAHGYSLTAQAYYNSWAHLTIDPSGKHTLLAYQWRSLWGLLYDTYLTCVFNLSIIPNAFYQMQSTFCPSTSQLRGVPLDNRHYWTKLDWEMWMAATCKASTRLLSVDALAYWSNTTTSDQPFTDLYQTVHKGERPQSPDKIEFFARPVQGGLYSVGVGCGRNLCEVR